MKTAIQTKDAPAAIGTYSQAVRAGDSVFLSGQSGLDPASMQLAEGMEAQTHRAFRNLAAVAGAAGLGLDRAGSMAVSVTGLAHLARVNGVMGPYVRAALASRRAGGVGRLA